MTEMRKKNVMAKEKLCYQMATSIKVNIGMDKDMDSGNTNLSVERQGNWHTEKSHTKNGKT